MRVLTAAALAMLLLGLPSAAASGSSLAIDPPNLIPPVGGSLRLALGLDWAFEGVVCKEASTARLILSSSESPGVAARLDPAVLDVAIPATGAAGATVSGREETTLVLSALEGGQGSVDVTAALALPDSCLALGGARRAVGELHLPLELRPETDDATGPASTASPKSESLLAAAEETSHLRTVELSERWHVPGPVIMLVVAIAGTVAVEVGRRILRAMRPPAPAT